MGDGKIGPFAQGVKIIINDELFGIEINPRRATVFEGAFWQALFCEDKTECAVKLADRAQAWANK